jgi:hypothetical protein
MTACWSVPAHSRGHTRCGWVSQTTARPRPSPARTRAEDSRHNLGRSDRRLGRTSLDSEGAPARLLDPRQLPLHALVLGLLCRRAPDTRVSQVDPRRPPPLRRSMVCLPAMSIPSCEPSLSLGMRLAPSDEMCQGCTASRTRRSVARAPDGWIAEQELRLGDPRTAVDG